MLRANSVAAAQGEEELCINVARRVSIVNPEMSFEAAKALARLAVRAV